MKTSLPLLLIYVSLILLLAACNRAIYKGFNRHPNPGFMFIPVFPADFEKSLYQVDISYNKKNLSGLAMIKKIEEYNSIRTVFMSETGLKYFDLEFFKNDSAVVHYVMDAMNRKGLVRTLTTDLGLLFESEVGGKDLHYYHSEKPEEGFMVKEKQNGHKHYYYSSSDDGPYRIYRRACFSPPSDIKINQETEKIPTSIIFTHGIIKFNIELNLITK